MTIGGVPMQFSLQVPSGVVRPRELLPVYRAVAERIIDRGVEEAAVEGRSVSCRKACGACCRQLVPLAPVEAVAIARLVEGLPGPRRDAVRERFRQASARMAAEGLAARLPGGTRATSLEEVEEFGLAYFRLGIPCPFLEDESCSIYADRPIVCREYLVTSPPVECSRPSPEGVKKIRLARSSWSALAASGARPGACFVPWVPLVLSLEFSEANPDVDSPQDAEVVVGAFLRLLGPGSPAGQRPGEQG